MSRWALQDSKPRLTKDSAVETPGVGSRKSKQCNRAVDPEPLVNSNEKMLDRISIQKTQIQGHTSHPYCWQDLETRQDQVWRDWINHVS